MSYASESLSIASVATRRKLLMKCLKKSSKRKTIEGKPMLMWCPKCYKDRVHEHMIKNNLAKVWVCDKCGGEQL